MSETRAYKGWIIEQVFPSGYWRATNYSDGYSPLMADTLVMLKHFIKHTMGLPTRLIK